MHLLTHTSICARLAAAALILSLAACSHGGSGPISSSGSGSSGGGSGAAVTFSSDDLIGSWFGKLVPDNAAKPERLFYVVVDAAGALVESADSTGHDWQEADAEFAIQIDVAGAMRATAESTSMPTKLVLVGEMDDAKETMQGTYDFVGPDGAAFSGSFTLTRSGGAGHFTLSVLEGVWDGHGTNDLGARRALEIELDASGGVVSGRIYRPVAGGDIHTYSPGAGTFVYSNDAVGRLDDVVLDGNDGSQLTFEYLLVSEDGELLGGPGHDSKLGAGTVELRRP